MITNYIEHRDIIERAMKAARLSWGTEHLSTPKKDEKLSCKLLKLGPSHAAALRQAPVWFHLKASRAFWQEFSKHVAGVEYYSESTMHTFGRKEYDYGDFYKGGVSPQALEALNEFARNNDREGFKLHLPESFLQTRAVMASYPALRNMCELRIKHKWPEWPKFLEELLELVAFPQFLTGE